MFTPNLSTSYTTLPLGSLPQRQKGIPPRISLRFASLQDAWIRTPEQKPDPTLSSTYIEALNPIKPINTERNRLLTAYRAGLLSWQALMDLARQIDSHIREPFVQSIAQQAGSDTFLEAGTPSQQSRGIFSDRDFVATTGQAVTTFLQTAQDYGLEVRETPFYYKVPRYDILMWKPAEQVFGDEHTLDIKQVCRDKEVMYIGPSPTIPLELLLGHLNKVKSTLGYSAEKPGRLTTLQSRKTLITLKIKSKPSDHYEVWVQLCKAATKVMDIAELDTSTERYKALKAFSKMQLEPQDIGLVLFGPGSVESKAKLKQEVRNIFAQAFQKATADLTQNAESLLTHPETENSTDIVEFKAALKRMSKFYNQLLKMHPLLLQSVAIDTGRTLAHYEKQFEALGNLP